MSSAKTVLLVDDDADFVEMNRVLLEENGYDVRMARITWYVVYKREYLACGKALGAVYREIMGRHYPAMTAVEPATTTMMAMSRAIFGRRDVGALPSVFGFWSVMSSPGGVDGLS